jgi:hypothetical protein
MLQEVSDELSLCQRYSSVYASWPSFRESLTEIYYHILVFLFRINDTLGLSSKLSYALVNSWHS